MLQNTTPKQIKLSNIKSILSRTDLRGTIKYSNHYFSEISGYSEKELVGSSHNIVRHPDMPKVIFKLMWNRIENNEDILAIVKNRTKNGDYYWVTTLFETKYHPFTKERTGYLAIRRAASEKAIKIIEPIYKNLLEIEAKSGVEASEEYLINFLMNKDKTYDEYVKDITQHKGLVVAFFNTMRKMFPQ